MNKAAMIRFLYSMLFYCGLPLVVLSKLWRARKAPDYGKRWDERFALHRIPTANQHGLWLHAVSLGEVNAALPLINSLLTAYPELPLTITTTTPTGSKRIQQTVGSKVFHQYLPFDLPGMMTRFMRRLQPKLGIIMETELWPNLCHICQTANIPLLLANARLSPNSARGYQRMPALTSDMLSAIDAIAAQTETDANRYTQLTPSPERVQVAGNLKFNLNVPANSTSLGQALRASWDSSRPVWIAASTHDGEEQQIFTAHQQVLEAIPDVVLIVVPRHPERFKQVVATIKALNYTTYQRSQGDGKPDCQIFIGDTMGEMMTFYAAADVAFVGGSLAPIGGHNPLEPMALGLPTIMGPDTFNMQTLAKQLIEAKAMASINDADSLAERVITLLTDKTQAQQQIDHANHFLQQHQHALDNHMQLVAKLLH